MLTDETRPRLETSEDTGEGISHLVAVSSIRPHWLITPRNLAGRLGEGLRPSPSLGRTNHIEREIRP